MRCDACLDHTFAGDNTKFKAMARTLRKLLHENSLRSSVALSEGLYRIRLGQHTGGARRKLSARQASQVVGIA
jgi:hypothetical protein